MDAITFFAVAGIAVVYAVLAALGGLAVVLWAVATATWRSWQMASEWRRRGAAIAIGLRNRSTAPDPGQAA